MPVIAGSLNEIGDEIMVVSDRQVPYDVTNLQKSGKNYGPEIRGSEVTVTLGYGGAGMAYALAVHETPSAYDPPSWVGKDVQFRHGRKAHYLSDPVKQAGFRFAVNMSMKLKGRLERALAR